MEQHVSKNAEEWREKTARKAREKAVERQKRFVTSSEISGPALLSLEDLTDFD